MLKSQYIRVASRGNDCGGGYIPLCRRAINGYGSVQDPTYWISCVGIGPLQEELRMVPHTSRELGAGNGGAGLVIISLRVANRRYPFVGYLIPGIPHRSTHCSVIALNPDHEPVLLLRSGYRDGKRLEQIEFDCLGVRLRIAGELEIKIPDEVLQRVLTT